MLSRGIKFRLIGSLVVMTLIILSIFFVLLNYYFKDYSRKEFERTLRFLGSNASSLLTRELYNADYNRVRDVATSIGPENFDYMIIYDNMTDNMAFLEDEDGITASFKMETLIKNKSSFEKTEHNFNGEVYSRYLFLLYTPGEMDEPLGALVLGISNQRMKSRLMAMSYRLFLISSLLFLTLTLVIYFLVARIVRPIRLLSVIMGKFASGDYSVRSQIRTSDEIGDLSNNFNIMAEQINEQIESIELYSKNLEKMVEERTDELLKAMDSIKEKDKRLTQAEKIQSLNTVVSSIAHEINNPLAIISGNLQILEARATDEKKKKKLRKAEAAIQRIATLIDEINFFSGIKDVTVLPLEFSLLLSNALSKVVPEDVTVKIESIDDDSISSNQNLLTMSVENILKNSVEQFRHKGVSGEIVVRYFREPYYFVVEVIDNGGGVKEPERVFEPFYTTYNEKKGLGLTFAYHAIVALSGEISIENIEDGAKVTLKVPAMESYEPEE